MRTQKILTGTLGYVFDDYLNAGIQMLDCFDWATAEMRQRQSAVHQTELPTESTTNTYFVLKRKYYHFPHVCM